jgi:hypothetical protein
MMHRFSNSERPRAESQQGMALLVVLVLTVLISLAAYEFTFYMESQYRASSVHQERTRAQLAALSGLELAAALIELPPADRSGQGGLMDNPELLQNLICEGSDETRLSSDSDQIERYWRATIVAPRSDMELTGDAPGGSSAQQNRLRFGLVNESAKLHIPSLLAWDQQVVGTARTALLNLPGATPDSVDRWLQIIRQNFSGGGQATSLRERLDEARNPNGDASTSRDQLRRLWSGTDLNRNYRVDALETQLLSRLGQSEAGQANDTLDLASSINSPSSSALGELRSDVNSSSAARGWQDYLTWHSGYRNRSRIGQPRIDLNMQDLRDLHRRLMTIWPADRANFIIAYRQYGPVSEASGNEGASGSATSWTPDFSVAATRNLETPLELIDATVAVPVNDSADAVGIPSSGSAGQVALPDNDGQQPRRVLSSPFQSRTGASGNALEELLDEATTSDAGWIEGRVDISQAPWQVLVAVPGIDAELAQRIIQQRSNGGERSAGERTTIAWLLREGGVPLDTLREIEPYICCRSDVYSVQVVGFRDARSPMFRCTATLDGRRGPTRIRNLQSWHAWGNGFSLEELSRVENR